MANKFEKKEWEDRQAQYPSRRKLLPTNQENIYEVERAEGEVTVPGNAFDASNMNDLENRIFDSFGKLDATDIAVLDRSNVFSKNNVEDVLLELFMYASNGKKAFANAIGGSASSTFQVLANLAASIKQDRDSGKQLIANAIGGSASSTFQVLADTINNGKKSIATAVGETKAGSLKGTETLGTIANFIKANKASFQDGSGYVTGGDVPPSGYWEERINTIFSFSPNRISVGGISISFSTGASFKGNFLVSNPPAIMESGKYNLGVKDLDRTGFTLWVKEGGKPSMSIFPGSFNYTVFSVPS